MSKTCVISRPRAVSKQPPLLRVPADLPSIEEDIRSLDWSRRSASDRAQTRALLDERRTYEMILGGLTDDEWRAILRAAHKISIRNTGFGVLQALAWIRKTQPVREYIMEEK